MRKSPVPGSRTMPCGSSRCATGLRARIGSMSPSTALIRQPGGPMHWSRLVDLPTAAVILMCAPVRSEFGAESAALILVPLLTLGITMLLVDRIGAKLLNGSATLLAVHRDFSIAWSDEADENHAHRPSRMADRACARWLYLHSSARNTPFGQERSLVLQSRSGSTFRSKGFRLRPQSALVWLSSGS